MRTVYPQPPLVNGWAKTQLTPEEVENQRLNNAVSANERALNVQLLKDESFAQALHKICEQNPDIPLYMFLALAGTQHGAPPGPYDFADTPEKVLHYWRETNQRPTDPQQDKVNASIVRARERDAKQADKAAYVVEFNEWVAACKERNARHAQARLEHTERVSESKRILDMQTSDPAPVQPVKRQ